MAASFPQIAQDVPLEPGPRLERLNMLGRLLILLMAGFAVIGGPLAGLRITWDTWLLPCLLLPAAVGITMVVPRYGPFVWLTVEIIALGLSGSAFVYVALLYGGEDATWLAHEIDAMLLFDWSRYYRAVQQMPLFDGLLSLAYDTLPIQLFILPLLLLVGGAPIHARLLMNCLAVTLFATGCIAAAWPVLDAAVWHGFYEFGQSSKEEHVDHWRRLREGAMRQIDLKDMTGLITFPSFHTSAAVLFAGASAALRGFGWCFATLNGVMIAATPRWGTHYLADTVAGAALALIVMSVSWRLLHRPASRGL